MGVIGCGAIADYAHIPNCFNIPKVELSSFCDINESQLKLMGSKYGVERLYTSHLEMLEKESLDAVIIASSADSHCELILDCIDHGLHIFIEKPLAINLEEAARIRERWQGYDKKIQVGYQLRFLPNHDLAKQYMQIKHIGELLYLHMRSETLVIKPEETLLIDYTTHLIDLLRHFTDRAPIESIMSMQYGPRKYADIQEGATILFQFKSGLTANIETIWVPEFSWGGVRRQVEILGTHGKILSDQTGPAIRLYNEQSLRSRLMGSVEIYPKEMMLHSVPITDHAYWAVLNDFVEAVFENREPTVTVEDGYQAIKIADLAVKSHDSGQRMKLD